MVSVQASASGHATSCTIPLPRVLASTVGKLVRWPHPSNAGWVDSESPSMTVNCYFCGLTFHSVLTTDSGKWFNASDEAHAFVFSVCACISICSCVCTTIAVYLWKQVRRYSRICANTRICVI